MIGLKQEGASLDFLGYTFRYDRHKYLNVPASGKALKRERKKLREMTSSRMCFKTLPHIVGEMNRQMSGWANYRCCHLLLEFEE